MKRANKAISGGTGVEVPEKRQRPARASRQKGTGGETELLRHLRIQGLVRTPASSTYDLHRPGSLGLVQALATRPDRGRWLVTIDAEDFVDLIPEGVELQIEVKRYRAFSLHTIFDSKFRR